MKAALPFVVAIMSTVAIAQSPPSTTLPPDPSSGQEPSSSMHNPSTDGTANYSNGSGDDNRQMKACIAKAKAANPQISQNDIQRKCAKLQPKAQP